MTAGYLQMQINGNQDIKITGNPQISFFKSVYKRHSRFSIQNIIQDINGTPKFGGSISTQVNNSGDLLKSMYIELILPELNKPNNISWYGYTNNIGCSIIESIELRINDQIIETIKGDWIDLHSKLNNIDISKLTLDYESDYSIRNKNNIAIEKRKIYIPIPFFFTKTSGLALPIIALNNSDITVTITFKNLLEVVKVSDYKFLNDISIKSNSKLECNIWGEYIYLDKKEQQYFTTNKLEYLIEQVQFNGNEIINKNTIKKDIKLDFRHPVKELIWVITVDNSNLDETLSVDHNNITKYTTIYSNYKDTFKNLTLKLNSLNILSEFPAEYFRKIQSYYYHNKLNNKHIYSYSFALNPTNYQPSGYLNFSEINDFMLLFNFEDNLKNSTGCSTNGLIKVYCINYNILQINSGQGSLLYYLD